MTKLETLIVPEGLGKWLQSRMIGHSGAYFTTLDAMYHYWETVAGSPTGDFIAQNKKELIEVIIGSRGYRVEEEPLYYALIKGHELLDLDGIYWTCGKSDGIVFISKSHSQHGDFLTELSKAEWNKLGINDSNTDFISADS